MSPKYKKKEEASIFKSSDHEKMKELVTKNHLSYILITCSEPSEDGKMDVEMSCEGDDDLVGLLMQNAMSRLT